MPLLITIAALVGAGLALAGAVNAALITWLPASARGPMIVWATTLLVVATMIAAWWAFRAPRGR